MRTWLLKIRAYRFSSILLGGITALLFISPPMVLGQVSKETSPFLRTATGKRTYENLRLRVLRLESAIRRLQSSPEAEAQLLSIYEELALYACARDAADGWDFEVHEDDESCNRYLAKITTIEPKSFLPKCIEAGKHSQVCAKTFASQQTLPLSKISTFMKTRINTSPLGSGYQLKRDPDREQLSRKIGGLEQSLLQKEDEKEKEEITYQLIQERIRLLRKDCIGQPLIFYRTSKDLGTEVETFTDNSDPEIKELRSLISRYQETVKKREELKKGGALTFSNPAGNSPYSLRKHAAPQRMTRALQKSGGYAPHPKITAPNALSPIGGHTADNEPFIKPLKAKPTPASASTEAKDQSPLVRIRVLSDRCDKGIEALLVLDPLSKTALCIREGRFHPICEQAKITARRKSERPSRKKQVPHPPSKTIPTGNTF